MEIHQMEISNDNYKTVVLGASLKPYRYSYRAVVILKINGYEAIPVGLREGKIDGIPILTGQPEIADVHTITVYLNAGNQIPHYDYILSLKPKRIIFNPGAENAELAQIAQKEGIIVENACTLVLLSMGQYEVMTVL